MTTGLTQLSAYLSRRLTGACTLAEGEEEEQGHTVLSAWPESWCTVSLLLHSVGQIKDKGSRLRMGIPPLNDRGYCGHITEQVDAERARKWDHDCSQFTTEGASQRLSHQFLSKMISLSTLTPG